MNSKIAKTIYSYASNLGTIAVLFFFVKTLYFQIKYGLHIEPANDLEVKCDIIYNTMVKILAICYLILLIWLLDRLFDDEEEEI